MSRYSCLWNFKKTYRIGGMLTTHLGHSRPVLRHFHAYPWTARTGWNFFFHGLTSNFDIKGNPGSWLRIWGLLWSQEEKVLIPFWMRPRLQSFVSSRKNSFRPIFLAKGASLGKKFIHFQTRKIFQRIRWRLPTAGGPMRSEKEAIKILLPKKGKAPLVGIT